MTIPQAQASSGEPQPPSAPEHRAILSSESQVSRFDRWVEFLSAAVLALATVATAWCAYQSTLWGGEETIHRAAANAATIKASQYANEALQRRGFHANLFVEWAAAISEDNEKLADFLYQRFPPELKTATDAWLATQPLQNPSAPTSPFVMPEYKLAADDQVAYWTAQNAAELERASATDETADRYVLLTVLFASVLFFAGIAGKFQSRLIDFAMLVASILVFFVGLGIALTFPIQ